jgi:hypothetical protein
MDHEDRPFLIRDINNLQPATPSTLSLDQILAVAPIKGPADSHHLFRLFRANPMSANVFQVPFVPSEVHEEILKDYFNIYEITAWATAT